MRWKHDDKSKAEETTLNQSTRHVMAGHAMVAMTRHGGNDDGGLATGHATVATATGKD